MIDPTLILALLSDLKAETSALRGEVERLRQENAALAAKQARAEAMQRDDGA